MCVMALGGRAVEIFMICLAGSWHERGTAWTCYGLIYRRAGSRPTSARTVRRGKAELRAWLVVSE